MSETQAVILRGVTKRYSGHTAVESLSLSIPRGSLYGLLGPNGAGKTTTIRMILNILLPDEGTVEVLGRPAWDRTLASRIGYLPEERGLYRKMKVLELLVFLAEARGVGRREARRKAGEWLERLGLSEWAARKVEQLSKGMQQKVQFISTVLHDPELLILDEPFAGLDPVNSQVLKDTVVELARRGTTVLFSTHIMEHAEKLCDSVCIIARGKKVVDGPLSEVKRAHGGKHVILALEEWRDALIDEALEDRSVVTKVDRYGQYAELELADGVAPQEVLERVLRAGAKVTRFEVSEPSLHRIFIDKVGGTAQ